jgi:putative ABC transport system permease protein
MFKLNLKIALRNLWKHKTYTFINIGGLAIGMASCILIFIFIRYQLSFDNQFANKDRIYRAVSNWQYSNVTDESQGVPLPLANAMRNDFPQLEKVAAIQGERGVVLAREDHGAIRFKEDTRVFYTSPDFFDIFDFTWLSGNPNAALSQPNTVALSEEKARLYFGDWHHAIGKTLHYRNDLDLQVTAVFKDRPENTTLPLSVVISYATYRNRNDKNWGSVGSSSECYVLLKKGFSIADLDGSLAKFNKKYYNNTKNESGSQYHSFQSLKDIHYDERYGNFADKIMAKKQIYGLLVIGIFLLLTACINFINLATAQAVTRSKEVGIRKVMGSGRKQLMVQFVAETLTISLIAVLIACVLTESALPYMQNLFDEQISFSLFTSPVLFLFLIGLVLTVSVLAGFYPALVMSGFSPALAIKNKITTSNAGGLALRKILVVVQFTITIILIISTLVVLKQMNYMREKPLGFNPNAVAFVSLPDDSLSKLKHKNLKARLLAIPGVVNVSFCDVSPSSNNVAESDFSLNNIKIKDFQVRTMHADVQYFETFGLKFIAGKALSKSDTTNSYVVNETFLRKMSIQDPNQALGKLLTINDKVAPIVGVTKDFNDKSLHQSISPIAISSDQGEYYSVAIKMNSKQMVGAMKEIEKLWNASFPEQVYDASILNDDLNEYYHTEQVMGVLFRMFSGIIILISFVGLFGLISFITSQRTKEVAIRKVLGASSFELVKLLNGSFLSMVFFSNLIAWPLAYIMVSKWLAEYAYRIDLSIWPFAVAMVVSMTITLITITLRSYKISGTNPIDALKYE